MGAMIQQVLNLLVNEVNKMEMKKPETNLEKEACKQAIERVTKAQIASKEMEYAEVMRNFISAETNARNYRKEADGLKDVLGLNEKQIKELF